MTQHAVVDEVIISVVQVRWRKVAMVVGMTLEECEKSGIAVAEDDIGARIKVMVKDGRLDAQGDVSNWRFSEVRLPKDEREE